MYAIISLHDHILFILCTVLVLVGYLIFITLYEFRSDIPFSANFKSIHSTPEVRTDGRSRRARPQSVGSLCRACSASLSCRRTMAHPAQHDAAVICAVSHGRYTPSSRDAGRSVRPAARAPASCSRSNVHAAAANTRVLATMTGLAPISAP